MCLEAASNSMQQVSTCFEENILPPIWEAKQTVCGFWAQRCNEVKVFTDNNLPYHAAIVTQKVFNALPFTLYFEYSPAIISIPVTLGYIGAHIVNKETPPFSTKTYQNIYNGLGCYRTLNFAKNIVNLAITNDPCNILAAVINLISAAWAFHKAETM